MSRQESADVSATYRPLREDPTEQLIAGDHLAIHGSVLFDYQSKSTTAGKTDHYVIPMVPADWHRGEPIRLLLKVHTLADVYGSNPTPAQSAHPSTSGVRRDAAISISNAAPLLIRIGGTLSMLDTRGFRELADDYHVGFVIPSDGEKPLEISSDYLTPTLVICGGASFLVIFICSAIAYTRGHPETIQNYRNADEAACVDAEKASAQPPEGMLLRTQVSHTATAVRCGTAAWILNLILFSLMHPIPLGWQASAIFWALSFGPLAWEVCVRRSRVSLMRTGDSFAVFKHGRQRGTIRVSDLRYVPGMDPHWRFRQYPLVFSLIIVPISTTMAFWNPAVGVVACAAALFYTASWMWDLGAMWRVYWVEADGSHGVPPRGTERSSLMRKRDMLTIFGVWPPDQWRAHLARGAVSSPRTHR